MARIASDIKVKLTAVMVGPSGDSGCLKLVTLPGGAASIGISIGEGMVGGRPCAATIAASEQQTSHREDGIAGAIFCVREPLSGWNPVVVSE